MNLKQNKSNIHLNNYLLLLLLLFYIQHKHFPSSCAFDQAIVFLAFDSDTSQIVVDTPNPVGSSFFENLKTIHLII